MLEKLQCKDSQSQATQDVPSHPDGRTQCRELPLCAGSGEGCQWQALPSPEQCEETATRTQDLPVTGGKTLPLAPGPPFTDLDVHLQNIANTAVRR